MVHVIEMKERGSSMRADFLDLPVKTRNRATSLFNEIKAEMKRGYALKDLGLNAYLWDDASLSEFMSLPKAHYLRIVKGKPKASVSRQNLIVRMDELYGLFDKQRDGRVK